MKTFRSNGKLLLSGEYVVLDGAKALAIPTVYGQSLIVEENLTNSIVWKSYNENNEIWFEDAFTLVEIATPQSTEARNDISIRLIQILKATKELNPEFLNTNQGYNITTQQDFNRKWGLGTSSTLINNIANWANVDAYTLLEKTFGGSGYDIACAKNNSAILYQRINSVERLVQSIDFNPTFKDSLYFVYLNEKQNSRDGIKAYQKLGEIDSSIIKKVNKLTESMIVAKDLFVFEALLKDHEELISRLTQQPTIKSQLFNDFDGTIKSLGAWGGDFVLVASKADPTDYFKSKGYNTIIPYKEMVLN